MKHIKVSAMIKTVTRAKGQKLILVRKKNLR